METKQELRDEIRRLNNEMTDLKTENIKLIQKLDQFDTAYENWKTLNGQFLDRYIKDYLKNNLSIEMSYTGDYGQESQLSNVNISIDDVKIISTDNYPSYF
jgi:5'-deoxynucleotidase YfbR-like HD superfamily hydrolase